MSVQAIAKGVRMSPRKVGVVAALVRGRTVADALVILDHVPRRTALAVKRPSRVRRLTPITTMALSQTPCSLLK